MPKRQQEIRWRRCEQVWQPIMLIIYVIVIVLLKDSDAAPLPEVDWPPPPKTSERSPTSISHNTLTFNDTKFGNSSSKSFLTWHGRVQDDGKTLPLSNASIVLTVSDHESSTPSSAVTTNRPKYPPSFRRKIKVLAFILGCCCLVAITVNFINLHSDYEELQEFYIGYMGRKMLIQERRLTSRTYLNLLRREHQLTIENDEFMEITEAFQSQPSVPPPSASSVAAAAVVAAATCLSNDHRQGLRPSPKRSPNCNGHAASTQQALQVYRDGEISFIPLQERGIVIQDGFVLESETSPTTPPPLPVQASRSAVTVAAANVKRKTAMMTTKLSTNSRKYRELMTAAAASPHKKIPNMSVIVMQQPTTDSSEDSFPTVVDSAAVTTPTASPPFGTNGSEEWLLPLLAKEFIEDHDVEWRNLDYSSDVGPPPTSFWLFICQYDCRIFPQRMSEREEERRKNLLNQFRLWKLLKRKHWNIVVTERAKKEMADREQDHMRR